MTHASSRTRIAIPCLRTEIRGGNDERDMRAVGAKLGYHVDKKLLVLNPTDERPLTTILTALHDTPGAAIIVPNLQHIDGLDDAVRLVAEVITVDGENVLERAHTTVTHV